MLETIRKLPESERAKLYGRLQEIYRRLDEKLARFSPQCLACGGCCDFEKAEHRLYVSSLEIAWFLEGVVARRALADHCPWMGGDGRCEARERRMIGCRAFFCRLSPRETEDSQAMYEAALLELKAIYREQGLPWIYRDAMLCFRENEPENAPQIP